MKRAILAAILLLLSTAIGARAQSITVYSHTTILANGEAVAECGTVMNDSGTIANYLSVDVWCGFYRGTTLIDEFLCPQGKPSSQCQRIYTTTTGQEYQTTGEHAIYFLYYSPCLQFFGGYYDPYYYAFPQGFPTPHFDESGQRLANPGSATCWASGPGVIAYTDSYRDTTMSVSPTQVTLYESQTEQLNANLPATWSVIQGNGTVDGNGLYRAPASIAGEQTAIVQACDVQNSVNCAKATITLKNATLTVTPAGQEVLPGTTKAYQASIAPSTFTQTFDWSRTPAVGTIDANSGVYTAPANSELSGPVQITVKACSKTVPTLCGTTTLQVPRVTIGVPLPSAFLATPGNTLTVGANVGGPVSSPEVTFTVAPGNLTPLGFNTVQYTPPAITEATTATFHACLKDSPATCNPSPDPSMVLVPPIVITSAGTWNAGTAAPITITGTGFGTAPNVLLSDPSIPFSYVSKSNTSIVINAAVPVSAGGRVLTVAVNSSTAGITPPAASANVTPSRPTLGISPGSAPLREAQSQNFSTTCTAAGGAGACAGLNSVSWFATLGSITSTGPTTAVYTAPASVASTTSVSVKACWSLAPNEQCAVATVTITPLTVDVTPAAANVNGCSTQRFTAAVSNAPTTTVTWSINPGVGAIDSTGLYTAPCPVTAQSTVEVKACSTANPQKCDTSTVTLVPVTVTVNPSTPTNVSPNGTLQFSSVVQGTTNTAVTWSISPAVPAAGSIDSSGLYRAPSVITTVTTVTVTATSQANNNIKGTGQVNLVTASASLSPTSLTFAAQDLGTTSAAQTVTLSNTGTASFSLTSSNIGGDFTQTNNCGLSLAPGVSCFFQIKFVPTGVGTRTGALTISDTAPGSPHVVNLSGTGRGPLASLSPASLDFGGHRPGFASPAKTVTLSNTGTGAMSISSISVTGEYTQTNNCSTSLAAGTSCAISVKFNPAASSVGQRTGSLQVVDSAAGSPHTASLTGSAYGGFHDASTCSGSSGWAWDPARPNIPINVYIFEGNNLLATVLADKYRSDLAGSGYGNGYHAFDWPMLASLKDGQAHTITIRYSSDVNAVHIPGSPKSVTCTPTPTFQGYHDSASCVSLTGWGWDSTQPNTAITLYIFEGTVSRGSVLANQLRQDLVNAGIGNGRHGFDWVVPVSLKDGQTHNLTVRFGSSSSSQALTASPKSINCPAPVQPTASVEWIQPAEDAWGPAGTLTAAGLARDGSGTVQLVWRERSSSGVWGSWTTVSYRAPVSSDGTWSNTISSGNPTDKCHWFDAYVNYSGITSATYRYTGAPGCP